MVNVESKSDDESWCRYLGLHPDHAERRKAVSQHEIAKRMVAQLFFCNALGGSTAVKIGEHCSGKKKEPKPELFGLDIFRWGGGLPCKRVGAKKFGMSLEAQETKLFWRDIPGFCRDIPGVPEKFEKKGLCLILGP